MKIADLRAALPPYIEWLGLNDLWKEFEIRWARKGELPDDEDGNVSWQIDHRKVTIILRRGVGLRVAVHELVHVRIEGHGEPFRANPHYEQTVWHLTDKLLDLHL